MSKLPRKFIAATLALACGAALVTAQAPQPDRVEVRNRKDGSIKSYSGKLTLSSAGFEIKDKQTILLDYDDIVKIIPGELPGVDYLLFKAALNSEEKKTAKDYEAARNTYDDLLRKAKNAPEFSKRHLEFRIALMSTRIADSADSPATWRGLAEAAAKQWNTFFAGYSSGWELWPAARTLARLNVELGQHADNARLWSRIGKLELPPALRLEAAIQEADAYLRSKNPAAAATVVAAALKSAQPGPLRQRLEIYDAAAKAAQNLSPQSLDSLKATLDKIIAATDDPTVRAAAFGVIGELYWQAGRYRDAMWALLWVDTVYNTDKLETFKAMCRLQDVFKALKDEERAEQQYERIRRARENL